MTNILMVGWREWMNHLPWQPEDRVWVLCDPYHAIPAITVAEPIPVVDAADAKTVLTALEESGIGRIDSVATDHEDLILMAALLRDELSCSGRGLQESLIFRDKALQKQRIVECGIRTAEVLFAGAADFVAVESLVGRAPVVIKPRSGKGAMGVAVLRSVDDLRDYMRTLDPNADVMVESLQSGDECHIDGCVIDGSVTFVSVSRYVGSVISARASGSLCGVTVSNDEDPDICSAALELAQRVCNGLALDDSVFHLEAFWRPDGFSFSELGARLGGGLIAPCVKAAHGVDLRAVFGHLSRLDRKAANRCTLSRHGRSEVAGYAFMIGDSPDDTSALLTNLQQDPQVLEVVGRRPKATADGRWELAEIALGARSMSEFLAVVESLKNRVEQKDGNVT